MFDRHPFMQWCRDPGFTHVCLYHIQHGFLRSLWGTSMASMARQNIADILLEDAEDRQYVRQQLDPTSRTETTNDSVLKSMLLLSFPSSPCYLGHGCVGRPSWAMRMRETFSWQSTRGWGPEWLHRAESPCQLCTAYLQTVCGRKGFPSCLSHSTHYICSHRTLFCK